MSFGFSVGDVLGGASLAYQLCKALSETKGSSRDYQQLIAELNVIHKVLIQVEQLRVSNQLAQATLNALLFIINSANEAMEIFLADHEKYRESLKQGGSGNVLKDTWMKGKWALEMESEKMKLRQTLASMLVSINCLVQLACYFNTGYHPEVDTTLVNFYERRSWVFLAPFHDVKLQACMLDGSLWAKIGPNFKVQHQPLHFFRAGQVFSLCISAKFEVHHQSHRRVKLSQLPLEPIETLKAKQERTQEKDRERRLKQILSLPLAEMIQYCREGENGEVCCTLCHSGEGSVSYSKEDWVEDHFRRSHWQRYCIMRGISPDSDNLPSIASYLTSNSKSFVTRPISANSSHISPADWISMKDITSTWPIKEDWHIKQMETASWSSEPYIGGPVMVRRFVVIQEGLKSCLCLGIHTYTSQGCSNQVDQCLFAILHSSKDIPIPLEKETGIVLAPIRMKPEHPSTVLPVSSRIHFGRAYGISHNMPVKSLGLIHTESMPKLISGAEAHVYRNDSSSNTRNSESINLWVDKEPVDFDDEDVIPADMKVVKDMRSSITDILGPDISLNRHLAPIEPLLGLSSFSEDMIENESSRETKRARII